jgi:hypothetical protein
LLLVVAKGVQVHALNIAMPPTRTRENRRIFGGKFPRASSAMTSP